MAVLKNGTLALRVATRSRWCLLQLSVVMLLTALVLGYVSTPCFADDGPVADPAGTATGDKTTTYDAAGNSFAVAAPTDPNAPDFGR